MSELLQLFIWIPFVGLLVGFFVPSKNERIISGIAIANLSVYLLGLVAFLVYWTLNDFPVLDRKHIVLFETDNMAFFIDYYFDKLTAVFSVVGAFVALLVNIFSRYYIHRDEGFKRFFSTIMLFFLGYNIMVFSGNFETFFVGWEILGICSFLLIAFYRDRYLPVKNSLKVISIYRVGDICLMLAMWMSHHLWHQNITFLKLNDANLVTEHLQANGGYPVFIAAMFLIAAAVKSAQLPFSSWLPRAMEGPTTSSAIFYGSLSVHLGVFLLLRTYPYWESMAAIKTSVIVLGIVTSLVANGIARVQSSVKVQIAYSSIAQIGLMFIEVGLDFHILALVHFAGNAFLRTYQLLVSPSVMSYLIHNMVFNFVPKNQSNVNSIYGKLKNSIYMLSIKEWNLDFLLQKFLWNPFKWAGRQLNFLTSRTFAFLFVTIIIVLLYFYFSPEIPEVIVAFSPMLFSLFGLLFVLRAFVEKANALTAWSLLLAGQVCITLSVALLNPKFGLGQVSIYLSGILLSSLLGYYVLLKIRKVDNDISLNRFHGYVYEQPKLGFLFLLSCLGFVALPLTPAFVGIDILFSQIFKHEMGIIICTSCSFLVMEISVLRIYARIFMGQSKRTDHAMAYRSS